MSELDDLYQEVILDHYKKPRCCGCLCESSASCTLYNPLCGDQVDFSIKLEGQKIADIAFSGHGCSISQAAASMVSALCKGKSVADAKFLCSLFRSMMRGDKSGDEVEQLGDAVALEGVRKFSARVKCAMLGWEAVEKCLEQALAKVDATRPSLLKVLE